MKRFIVSRYGLLTFILGISIVGVLIGMSLKSIADHNQAARMIREAGGVLSIQDDDLHVELTRGTPEQVLEALLVNQPSGLRVWNCKLGVRDARIVGSLTNLKSLDLKNITFAPSAVRELQGLSTLTRLQLVNCSLSDSEISLSWFPQLEHLDLSDNLIGNHTFTSVEGATELQSLVLTNTRITDEGIVALSQFTRLGTLVISGCDFSRQALAALLEAGSVQMVTLYSTNLTDADIGLLKKQAPNVTFYY